MADRIVNGRDWIDRMFPGDGAELPRDEERDLADYVIREWAQRWDGEIVTIRREDEGHPTNRADMRSQIRAWWRSWPVQSKVQS